MSEPKRVVLELQNPHSVTAALETRPEDVVEIRLASNKPSGPWAEAVRRALDHSIPVLHGVGKGGKAGSRRRKQSNGKGGRGGTTVALVREQPGLSLEEVFADAETRGSGRGLWLALDCLQDPHNVGAVFRSAAFFGVQGIVVTRDRSAPLNATVYDVASGGIEYTPFSVQTNLKRALETAKQAGLWILGTSERANRDISDVERDRPWLLVMGNEEKGLRRLTQKTCDEVCRLTPRGPVGSLNVSVAAGILIASLAAPVHPPAES